MTKKHINRNMPAARLALLFAALTAICLLCVLCACGNEGKSGADTSGTTVLSGQATEGTVTTSAGEDPATVTGWFDYGTALYQRDNFTPGTSSSISIQMAKN